MEKHEKKAPKQSVKGIFIVAMLIIVLALIPLFVLPQGKNRPGDESDVPDREESDVGMELFKAETFPLLLEDGNLVIENTFLYEGMNPDCENQEGSNIVSITVRNTSENYLSSAEITMKSDAGKTVHFTVADLPAGKTAMAFSKENESVENETVFGDVNCKAVFDTDVSLEDEKISLVVNGTHIALQNNTDKEMKKIVVYCRTTLGDQYFGGITYIYTVDTLPASGIAEIEAVDCILGLAEVVRIEIKE